MEWKSDPRNKNITIRITKNEKREFEELARKNRVSRSNWAYHILCKYKHNYDKIEDIDHLLEGLEIAIKGLKFNIKLLEIEMDKATDPFSSKNVDLVLLRSKIGVEIINLKKVKNEIEEKAK